MQLTITPQLGAGIIPLASHPAERFLCLDALAARPFPRAVRLSSRFPVRRYSATLITSISPAGRTHVHHSKALSQMPV